MVVVGPFQPLILSLLTTAQACFLPPLPFVPTPSHVKARPGFYQPKKNNTKTKSIELMKTMCGLHEVFELTASSEEGCLNTPRLFSLGGELTLIFFL